MVTQMVERDAQAAAEDPFFILYDSRSGSTFLANELSKRFKVVITPETNFITDTLDQFGYITFQSDAQLDALTSTIMSDRKFGDLKIDHALLRVILGENAPLTLADAVRLILNQYRDQHQLDGYYYGIKNGKYVHTYHEILRLFPTAKFIGLVRDGRAVFHSQKQAIASASGRPMARDPKIAARRWVRITKLLRELELDHHGVLILNYETLIKDTDATMDRVGAFLDVDRTSVDDKPRDYEIAERYRPELHSNVNRAPLTNRISAWRTKLSPAEIAEFEAVARDCLIDEGYELEGPTRPALGWKKWFT